MIVSHEWLKQFVPHTHTADEIGALLSRHCVTLDGIERIGAELAPFVIGQVVEVARHPNSDRLWITKVDDGSGELLDVVCGAPVVLKDAKYPFARTGTAMPGGLVIEKRKIRGEISNGMLCSARELGLGDDHTGILQLETDAAPGTPLLDVLPLSDARLDLDVLPNRPDLLSHRGVAREISALLGRPWFPTPSSDMVAFAATRVSASGATRASGKLASVEIVDTDNCPRYLAAVISGVKVGDSPEWLRRRLASVGIRSLGNIVDATNYVLQSFGQPVHAFDLDKLAGNRIVVRSTREGEGITTLDGVARSLPAGTTVIADGARPVALAGVMGGRDSEVTETTTRVLLEVAAFNPRFVRSVRKHVGLNTDASYRFERGIDAAALLEITQAAAALITQVAGGTIEELLVVGADASSPEPVKLRPSRVKRLLGVPVASSEIVRRLESLGFSVSTRADDHLEVTPPTWRHDISLEVDLIEEVARVEGFDALPNELRPFRPGTVPDDALHVRGIRVRDMLVSHGLFETRPMPFTSKGDEKTPRVRNPLADDEPYLRSSLLDTLAGRVEYNLSRMQGNVRIFEVGNAFIPSDGRLPREELRAAAVITGDRRPVHFTEPRPPAFDQWDAKALAESIAAAAYPDASVVLGIGDTDFEAEIRVILGMNRLLWTITVDERPLGRVVELNLDKPEWADAAFGVELLLGVIPSSDVAPHGQHAPPTAAPKPDHRSIVRFRPLPTTPPAVFDLALVVPDSIESSAVANALRKAAGELLEQVQLFDEYRGPSLGEGQRSLAWRLTLRHPERTLREKEIEGRRARILDLLDKELGIRPRAT